MEIVPLGPERFDEASVVLARAFHDDPAWTWVVPSSRRRAALLPWLFRVAFATTEAVAWTTSGPLVGAVRWFPPGQTHVHVGPMMRALLATPLRVREATPRFLAYGRAVESLRFRAAAEPHWYLAGIGVDPDHRRRGIGGALLEPGISAASAARVPCVLVTNTEANLAFYARHGFEVLEETRTPERGPPAWLMRRNPTV